MGASVFKNGNLTVDYAAGCAYLGGEELHLTPIEYKLLCLLSQNVGKVLTHSYITNKIWGGSRENDLASMRVFMASLRKKLESFPDSPQYIQTHIGVGYRMVKTECVSEYRSAPNCTSCTVRGILNLIKDEFHHNNVPE